VLNPGDPAQPRHEHVFAALIERALRPAAEPVQRRVATTIVLALARVQRDPALSPPVALALSDRLARLAGQLAASNAEWSRGLGRLLADREALAAALADQRRLVRVPPGMPIGAEGEEWPGL
jgi:hypothetical protein